jgi:hypothetical protein
MNGGEGYDGRVGESYIQPASNRKGRRVLPGWRDPDWSASNWKAVRRMSRFYFWALMLPLLFLLWFSGYGYALLTACPVGGEIISKESSNVR